MSDESQLYLDQLTTRILQFAPTAVLLEYDPRKSEEINSSYQNYLSSNHLLKRNEIEQLGFRIAKKCNHKKLYSFDEREVMWKGEELIGQIEKSEEFKLPFDKIIQDLTQQESQNHKTMNLKELFEYCR